MKGGWQVDKVDEKCMKSGWKADEVDDSGLEVNDVDENDAEIRRNVVGLKIMMLWNAMQIVKTTMN